MSVQNFDPEWAKHLKHDPDQPLAPNCPVPALQWEPIRDDYEKACAPAEGERTIMHDPDRRPPGSWPASDTVITCTLTLHPSGETLSLPIQIATTCREMQEALAEKAGMEASQAGNVELIAKMGCTYKKLHCHDTIARHMTVKGIKGFTRVAARYEHPRAIIGAGHIGLRTAMCLTKKKRNFVVFDRMFRVGGTSWMYQANSTSKLQTEYGSYHLDYGMEFKIPTEFTTPWPSRNALLDHFQRVANETGIMPHIKLNTNVKFTETKHGHYLLTTEEMSGAKMQMGKMVIGDSSALAKTEAFKACSISLFPGNLTLPRMVTFPGEDEFDAQIGYGMFNDFDYNKLAGENVTIVGHGAFAIENLRTCCEFECGKIYLVCRRTNLACPRVASMASNRSMFPLTNARFLKVCEPMYRLIGRDPWTFYSVSANAARTVVQINQKARFACGDIYFLAINMGKCELIVDDGVKRLGQHTVHLCNGRSFECKAFLKLLGLTGEFSNDKLLNIQEMNGFWVNGDSKVCCIAEPVSVMSSNMATTSLSPGAFQWMNFATYFVDFPEDFTPTLLHMLPKHKVDLTDEGTPRPAYVVDARFGTMSMTLVDMQTPAFASLSKDMVFFKPMRYRLCHPLKKFLAQCKEDWDHYAKKFLQEGYGTDRPYPEYPYTGQVFMEQYYGHMYETGEPALNPWDDADVKLLMG